MAVATSNNDTPSTAEANQADQVNTPNGPRAGHRAGPTGDPVADAARPTTAKAAAGNPHDPRSPRRFTREPPRSGTLIDEPSRDHTALGRRSESREASSTDFEPFSCGRLTGLTIEGRPK